MSSIVAIGAIDAGAAQNLASAVYDVQPLGRGGSNVLAEATATAPTRFADLLGDGLARMDSKIANADRMVTQFALDGNTPIHHVTIALEEARLSVEMAMQVRQRLVEGYRELMNMQL